MIVEEKVSQMTMVQGLTDLKETFKLNGDASLSLLRVELNHASFVSAASLSWEKWLSKIMIAIFAGKKIIRIY